MRKRAINLIKIQLAVLLLLAGCAQLNQGAYEGFNRDHWQQQDRVIQPLQIRPGGRGAARGTGTAYSTIPLTKGGGREGTVYAVDVDKEMNDIVAERAKRAGLANVEVILAKPEEPLLPLTAGDLIFTSNTYHHIANRVNYFA